MSNFLNTAVAALGRYPALTILATITLGAGAVFTINNSSGSPVLRCYNSTGCVIHSNLEVTGTLTNAGSPVGGGLTFGTAQGIYVNQSGDTMTGALNVLVTGGNANTLGVVSNNTISGSVLYGYQGKFHTSLSSSGSLSVEGTMSGSSIYGKRCPAEYAIQYTASGTALAVNSGTTLTVPIAYTLSGYSLSRFTGIVDSAGVTGLTRFSIRNVQKGKRQLFSTNPSIDTAETSTRTAATPYVINASNDDVSGGDSLSFDILQIQTGTAPKGLKLFLEFSCP